MTHDEINKFLAEIMGKCWHECGPGPRGDFKDPPPYACPKCGEWATDFQGRYCSPERLNPNFFQSAQFVEWMQWAGKQKWFWNMRAELAADYYEKAEGREWDKTLMSFYHIFYTDPEWSLEKQVEWLKKEGK